MLSGDRGHKLWEKSAKPQWILYNLSAQQFLSLQEGNLWFSRVISGINVPDSALLLQILGCLFISRDQNKQTRVARTIDLVSVPKQTAVDEGLVSCWPPTQDLPPLNRTWDNGPIPTPPSSQEIANHGDHPKDTQDQCQ
jgi:hypothetical protein